MEKCCPVCQKPIKGRSDKKFCNDYCRNTFNNHQYSYQSVPVFKKTNQTLTRNRRVLNELLTRQGLYCKIAKEALIEHGFLFKYHTHQKILKTGETVYFCYDLGYMKLNTDHVILLRDEDSNRL